MFDFKMTYTEATIQRAILDRKIKLYDAYTEAYKQAMISKEDFNATEFLKAKDRHCSYSRDELNTVADWIGIPKLYK